MLLGQGPQNLRPGHGQPGVEHVTRVMGCWGGREGPGRGRPITAPAPRAVPASQWPPPGLGPGGQVSSRRGAEGGQMDPGVYEARG